MTDKTINLDRHRGMAAQKATGASVGVKSEIERQLLVSSASHCSRFARSAFRSVELLSRLWLRCLSPIA
jgi:hypothetical protein